MESEDAGKTLKMARTIDIPRGWSRIEVGGDCVVLRGV